MDGPGIEFPTYKAYQHVAGDQFSILKKQQDTC